MIAFSIWPIDIYRYGIFYLVGFAAAYLFIRYIWKTKILAKYPRLQTLITKKLDDLIIAAVLWVIIGGRLGHVLIYDLQYFFANPIKIFAVREGGMSFIGGMLWVTIAFIILKIRQKLDKKEFLLLMDTIIVMVPLWIMLGRFGNFLNQELYGVLVPSNFRDLGERSITILKSLHIFHIYPNAWPELRVNTNFLASFFEWFTSLVIVWIITIKRLKTKILKPGIVVWHFLIRYSIARFFIEYVKQESQTEFILFLTKSQRFFVVFIILWIYLIYYWKKNKELS